MLRKIIAIVVALLALLVWWITLTVPMIAATAPAIIAITLSILVYFLWPKNRNRYKDGNEFQKERLT